MNNKQIKATFDAFAARGNSIVVTGCGGCGTSTVAFNLANTICNLGYTVLLVDMDTVNKAQSYMSRDAYEAITVDDASVMSAVNSSHGISAHVAVIRQGFHLLTMGMGSDTKKPDEAFVKDKVIRFVNSAKASHNFIIYDVPFEYAVGHLEGVLFGADNVVLTIDASNWGVSKALLHMCNIGNDDIEENLFNRTQLLFNRCGSLSKVLGRKIRKITDIPKIMDRKLYELAGNTGYSFERLHICGCIKDSSKFEAGWFDDVQYSDTKDGFEEFVEILRNIVLHT